MFWTQWLLDLFFPPRCVLCGRVVESGCKCCTDCIRRYHLTGDEQKITLGPEEVLVLFRDGEASRRGVNKIKFRGEQKGLEYFGLLLAKMLKDQYPKLPFDGVTFVPMPEQRRQYRGYNQAEELARIVAAETGIPLYSGLLEKRDILTQHDLSSSMRRKRKGGCRLVPGIKLHGERLLLVDDICTTGETLKECSALLRQAGASMVVSMVLLYRVRSLEDEEMEQWLSGER